MTFLHDFWWWMLGIHSPSQVFAKAGKKLIAKPISKGIKQAEKLHKKYLSHRKRFERKWLKQHQHWGDGRQKKKAMEKAFLEEFPHHSYYIKLERLARKCKI